MKTSVTTRWERAASSNGEFYAASRVLITPNYQGHNTTNASEILGRGMAQGISSFYYPSTDRTLGALAVRFGYAVSRDALTNVFREFWPDIATHVLHRHPWFGRRRGGVQTARNKSLVTPFPILSSTGGSHRDAGFATLVDSDHEQIQTQASPQRDLVQRHA
jgi:hypothetical protein